MIFLATLTIAAGLLAAHVLWRASKITGFEIFVVMIFLTLYITTTAHKPTIVCPENTAPYYYNGESYCIAVVQPVSEDK